MNKTKAIESKEITPMKFDVETLISQAINKKVPVATMEKLLSMRKELKNEWAKEQFTKAMAAFQAECPTIQKTKEVRMKSGVVAYRYAPIESIVEQVKTAMQTHGFSYATGMEFLENGTLKVKVSIKVTHKDGHSEITGMTVPLGNKTDIMSQSQVVAAAQTFAKRYAFCNAFGILTGDEDTDARPVVQEAQPATPAFSNKASEKQIQLIAILLAKKGRTDQELYVKYNVESKKNLTKQQASTIIENLQKLPDKNINKEWEAIKNEEIVDPDEVAQGMLEKEIA